MKTLREALRPVRRRVRLLRALRFACMGLAVGSACALLLCALSLFSPVMYLPAHMGALCALGALAGTLAGLLMPVPLLRAAKTADACGLMARAQTALALSGSSPRKSTDDSSRSSFGDSPMTALQRQDAVDALRALNIKKALPMRVHKAPLMGALFALLVCAGLLFVQTGARQTAAQYEQYIKKMETQTKAVEEKTPDTDGMRAQDAEELNKILRELAQTLKTSVTPKQALTAVAEAEKRVENLNARAKTELQSALDAVGMQALSQALEAGGSSETAQQLSQEGAAQSLSDASQAASDAKTAQALAQAAKALQNGSLSQAQSALAKGMQSGMDAQALKAMLDSIRASALSAGGLSMYASGSGQTGSGQTGAAQGTGSVAGTGTTNQDMSQQGAQSGSPQKGSAEPGYRITDYETIYDPTRLGDGGEISNSQSQTGEGERIQAQMGAGLGVLDGSVPYASVIGEYQPQAVQSAQERGLPAYAQQWVTDYFDALVQAGGE